MRNRQGLSEDQESNQEDSAFIFKMDKDSTALSAVELLAMGPDMSGYCFKENTSIWVQICACWFPKWKKRFFILIGNYLFRYKDEHGERPKGVPIPLDSASVRVKEGACFEVSTIRKVYTIQTESASEASAWVAAIVKRKNQAIKESMGHAAVAKDITKVNRQAYKLFEARLQKDRTEGSEVNNPMSMNMYTAR